MPHRKEYFLKKIYPKHLAEMRAIGRRVIDIRVPDLNDKEKDYSRFMENDWLHFEDTNHEVLTAAVRYCKHYNRIEELLINEGIEHVWPSAKTTEEAISKSLQFPDYANRIKEHGVYALSIKKLSVYVAGPYSGTREEKQENIKKANKAAMEITKLGYLPLVSHNLFAFWEEKGFSEKECIALEKDLLTDKSDIFYFIGPSRGTNEEVKMAMPIMPVFASLKDLKFWKPVNSEL